MICLCFSLAFFSGRNAETEPESRLSCPLPDDEFLLIHGSAAVGSTVQYQCAPGWETEQTRQRNRKTAVHSVHSAHTPSSFPSFAELCWLEIVKMFVTRTRRGVINTPSVNVRMQCVHLCDYSCRLYLKSTNVHLKKNYKGEISGDKMCVHVEHGRDRVEVSALCAVCLCIDTCEWVCICKYFCYKFGKMFAREDDCVGGFVGVEDTMLPSAGSVWTSTCCVFKKTCLPPAGYEKIQQLLYSAWGHISLFHHRGAFCILPLQMDM